MAKPSSAASAGTKKAAPAKKTQHNKGRGRASKIAITTGRKKRGSKKGAADDDEEEPLVDPMPDHYPAVSSRPGSCLTAASPLWELDDMQQPGAKAGEGGADAASKSDAVEAIDEGKDESARKIDDSSDSELEFGTAAKSNDKKTGGTSSKAPPKVGGRLRPGRALQRCSGSDVLLSKTATNRPNLAKSRGRYLIILPGGLVPRVPDADQRERLVRAQKADGASYTGAGTDISAAKEANPKKEEEGNGDDDIEIIDGVDVTPKPPADTTTPAPPPSSKPAPFTPTTAPTVLGQLQKLGTADPVLVYLKISRCK